MDITSLAVLKAIFELIFLPRVLGGSGRQLPFEGRMFGAGSGPDPRGLILYVMR